MRLLLVVTLFALCAGASAQCSSYTYSGDCNGCVMNANCGWCIDNSGAAGGTSYSQCLTGTSIGPVGTTCGGTWVPPTTGSCGSDQCQYLCGLTCSSDQVCVTSQSGGYASCSCSDIGRLLGMAVATAAIIITVVCVAICAGIACCCYYLLRSPRSVIVQQPVYMAQQPAYVASYPQQQYAQGYPSQQPYQQLGNPNRV